MQWYYAEGDQRKGPVDQVEFEALVRAGTIRAETLVWQQGMPSWVAYSSVFGGISVATAPGATVNPAPLKYAGFWLRLVAKIIDAIALYIVSLPFKVVLFGTSTLVSGPTLGQTAFGMGIFGFSFLFSLALGVTYSWFFVSRFDATPGKMALGLKLVKADGSRLSASTIIGRYFAEWLSSIILLIGYIIAAFDDEKRTLHDRLCDTRVIKAK